MHYRILLLLLAGVLSPMISFSQGDFRPGFVIMSNGDSVAGYVDYRMDKKHWKNCYFRPSKKESTQRYSPQQVSDYGISSDKRYRSISLAEDSAPGEKVFVEVIVKGTLSLYRYKNIFYIDKDGKVTKLPERTKTLVEIGGKKAYKTDRTYIGLLNVAMADCKLVADNTNYKERDLTNIVQNYNRCHDQEGQVYKEKKPFTKFAFQAFGGVDLSSLHLENVETSSFEQSNSPIFGIGVDISSPRLNDKIFFSFELDYLKKAYQGSSRQQTEHSMLYYDYDIDVSFLKIPIGFRYNFLKEAQTPYVRIGISEYVGLKSSVELVQEQEQNGVVETQVTNYELESRSQTGFWLGVGFSRNVWKGKKFFVEFRYERAKGLLGGNSVHPPSITQNMNALVGIRF